MILIENLFLFILLKKFVPVIDALSKEFNPKAICVCSAKGFDITLETVRPFFGAIHPVNRTGCRINGIGKNRTNYLIPFSSGDFCNVRYEPNTNTYSVKIEVNEHQVLVLQRDRIFEFFCKNRPQMSSTLLPDQSVNHKQRRVQQAIIDFYDGAMKVSEVIYGNPYILRISFDALKSNLTTKSFRITNCFISDDLNTSLQIIDGTGCSTNCNLIEEFKYYENATAEAVISSMFRFPKTAKLEISCSVRHGLLLPKCQSRCVDRTEVLINGSNIYNNESDLIDDVLQTRKENLTPYIEEEIIRRTVTILNADSLLESAASDALAPAVTCTTNAEFSLLRNFCIVLCAAFLAGCSLNIVFCCIYLMKRNVKCNCSSNGIVKAKKKPEPSQLNCDFWIKEKTIAQNIGDTFDPGEWIEKPLPRPLSNKPYATVRQKLPHHHPNLSQISLRISQSITESPSLKSTDSSQTSTFGVRPILPPSYTVDTDLNSLRSSISTEKNTGFFLKNCDFPSPYNVQSRCLTNISSNSKEAYSIL